MGGQEPEDVALALWADAKERGYYTADGLRVMVTLPELARLVRAAQRRELEAVAKEVCDCCAEGEPVHCVVDGWVHDSEDWDAVEACLSGPVHARLALLREE